MNKNRIVLIFLFALILLPLLAGAAGPFDYTPLEKIPGSDTATSTTIDFYQYVSAVYKFGIWAVGIVALFMLVFGGYTYITSAGNNSSMETAKKIITDAIVGVIMALTAYLLLYVINPDLVKMKKLTPVAVVPAVPAVVPPPVGTYAHPEALAKLSTADIGISSSGNCSDANNSKCTSLDGITKYGIDQIIKIKNTCQAEMVITGGTETGHKSHGPGKSIFDIRFNSALADCIKNNRSSFGITQICTAPQDQAQYAYNCSYNETSRILHVAF